MTKLTYINDQQIINDAAQMLIESHLRWSGSTEGKPSKDLDSVYGSVYSALMESEAYAMWDEFSEDEKETTRCSNRIRAKVLFAEAAQIADSKWQAAMMLLGIEQ